MSHHVFTYGSLMFAQVWRRVVRGNYRTVEARVSGYARYQIVGETFPAMVAQANAVVAGTVYLDVDEHDVAALDIFEGADYRRDQVSARLDSGDMQAVDAYLYVGAGHLSNRPWQPETFQLPRFLETYCHLAPDQ